MIDWDLHPRVASVADLYPWMSVAWREYYRTSPFYAMTDREPAPAGAPAEDPAAFAQAFLDPEGVAEGVLVAIQAGSVNGLVDHVRAAGFVRAFNDHLVDRWLAADPRFRLAATVSPLDPQQAAREVRRLSRKPGVTAIFVPMINRLAGAGHLDPIFAACQRAGLPVLFHPTPPEGVALGAAIFAGGVPSTPEMHSALLPQIGLSILCSLTYDGAFERFPELQVILSDYGFEWVPTALWRLDWQWTAAGKRLGHARRRPSDLVRAHVSFCGAAAVEEQDTASLWSLLRSSGLEESIRFGSDAPYRSPGYRPKLRAAGAPSVRS